MSTELLPLDIAAAEDGGGKIAMVTLDQPGRPVVVIEQELLRRLDATLDSLPDDLDGFILASSAERAFVAGADLKAIMELSNKELHAYLVYGASVFQKIADLPCPTVAAIHSVALGGGLELAMHCDGLVGVIEPEGRAYIVGLPEAGLKICPGWGGTNLLPARIDPKRAIMATAEGTPFKSTEAAELGLFDETCASRDELIPTCRRWLSGRETPTRDGRPSRCIQSLNGDEVESALKSAREELPALAHVDAVLAAVSVGIHQGWDAAIGDERDHLVQLRNTEPAREAIEAFFAKSSKK